MALRSNYAFRPLVHNREILYFFIPFAKFRGHALKMIFSLVKISREEFVMLYWNIWYILMVKTLLNFDSFQLMGNLSWSMSTPMMLRLPGWPVLTSYTTRSRVNDPMELMKYKMIWCDEDRAWQKDNYLKNENTFINQSCIMKIQKFICIWNKYIFHLRIVKGSMDVKFRFLNNKAEKASCQWPRVMSSNKRAAFNDSKNSFKDIIVEPTTHMFLQITLWLVTLPFSKFYGWA